MVTYHYKVIRDSDVMFEVTWQPPISKTTAQKITEALISEKENLDEDEIRKSVGFCDSPWDSKDDIISEIESIEEIQNTSYFGVYDGKYGPPKVLIFHEDGAHEIVKTKLMDYYDGFVINKYEDGKTVVVISALASLN